MRKRFWLTSALLLAACNNAAEPGTEIVPTAQSGHVLLEIEYVNFAWVPTWLGFYVDTDGNVFSYDRKGVAWESDGILTEDQLEEKFSLNRTLVASRDRLEIDALARRITQVVPDQLSQPSSPCADAGILTYRAYHFDPLTRTYRPVLLRAEGDRAQQNLSPAAQELVAFLKSLSLRNSWPDCQP